MRWLSWCSASPIGWGVDCEPRHAPVPLLLFASGSPVLEPLPRSHTLDSPTGSTAALTELGSELLLRALDVANGEPATLIGLSVSSLATDDAVQLELDLDGGSVLRSGSAADLKRRSLDSSVDAIREKFGRDLVKLGESGRGDDAFRRLAERS